MKEVEVKAKVTDLTELKQKLESLGCEFTEPIIQDDRIYIKNGETLASVGKGFIALRIRRTGEKYVFTFKKTLDNGLHKLEHEFVIDNPDEAHKVILELDFYEASHVSKTRQKCKYQGMEICLDEVEGLGSFIETERLVEEGESAPMQEEMLVWLESVGVSREGSVVKGYDIMLYEKSLKA
ncbi:hypothetical protein BK004_03105 [bacterium CG10_46_32]|nr:MAG: hypothetical protein BK004_03105 [bacterium CG10_46_32]PIR55989.1 MAG: class IV adenylate cyclase [Parcubacteria group bacterium CG10_big_fil_rev_8_21_14_0_10_46_32]